METYEYKGSDGVVHILPIAFKEEMNLRLGVEAKKVEKKFETEIVGLKTQIEESKTLLVDKTNEFDVLYKSTLGEKELQELAAQELQTKFDNSQKELADIKNVNNKTLIDNSILNELNSFNDKLVSPAHAPKLVKAYLNPVVENGAVVVGGKDLKSAINEFFEEDANKSLLKNTLPGGGGAGQGGSGGQSGSLRTEFSRKELSENPDAQKEHNKAVMAGLDVVVK